MDFSFSSIMAGFVFGVFGWYLLKEGRKSGNFWHLGLGLGLMAYPYFISGPFLMWGIGIAGLALAYVMRTRF